jgi:hypothetical protein
MYRTRDFMIAHLSDSKFFVYSEILEMLESAYGRVRAIPDGMMLIEITLLRIVRRGDKSEMPATLSPKAQIVKPEERKIKPEIKQEKIIENTSTLRS